MIYGDMDFQVETDHAVLVRYRGCAKKVHLPHFVEDVPLTEIGPMAFRNGFLHELYLPDSISTIGAEAFCGCKNLSFICGDEYANKEYEMSSFGENLTCIGDRSFSNTRIKDISFWGETLSFGDQVFNNCRNLRTVLLPHCSKLKIGKELFANSGIENFICPYSHCQVLPEGTFANCCQFRNYRMETEEFGKNAFLECVALQHLDLTGLQRLYMPSFSGCEKLKKLTLPASLTLCTANAFLGSALAHFDIDDENMDFSCHGGILYDKQLRRLIACPPGRTASVTLPLKVYSICDRAFYGSSIEEISMPAVASIGKEAFFNSSLRFVSLPMQLKHLGDGAFSNCRQLEILDLPKTVHINYEEHFSYTPIRTVFYHGNEQSYRSRVSGILLNENVSLFLTDANDHLYETSQVKKSPLFTYLEYGRHIEILEVSGYLPHIDVPDFINGKPVTVLLPHAVSIATEVLILPETMKTVKAGALNDATSLHILSLEIDTVVEENTIPQACQTFYRRTSNN